MHIDPEYLDQLENTIARQRKAIADLELALRIERRRAAAPTQVAHTNHEIPVYATPARSAGPSLPASIDLCPGQLLCGTCAKPYRASPGESCPHCSGRPVRLTAPRRSQVTPSLAELGL